MSTDPHHQSQYPPPQWESHPQRGAYPGAQQPLSYRTSPSSQPYQNPPPSSAPGDMVTLPPPPHQQHPPDFHRPPMYDMYAAHPSDPYRPPPPPHPMYQNQPAPRQRTAIACRYCRRRKIRCSGFEASEDGRCTNCQRFQQECIFTPVSSQAQAFVPAHTAYPHLRTAGPLPPQQRGRPVYPTPGHPPAIYGAHGQRLGPLPPGQDPHYPPPAPHYAPGNPPPGAYPGPPPRYEDGRGGPPAPHPGGPPHHPHPTQDRVSRKRPRVDESSHPPPAPTEIPVAQPPYQTSAAAAPARAPGRRGSAGGQYEYPDPSTLVPVSPASSATSYHSAAPFAQAQQPYYTQPPPAQPQLPPHQAGPPGQHPHPPAPARRPGSPSSTSYSYDARASGSPHGSTTSSTGGTYHPYQVTGGLHPPQVIPPNHPSRDGSGGRTPPSAGRDGSNGRSGGGMAVKDLLSGGDQGRSVADRGMLKSLDKGGM